MLKKVLSLVLLSLLFFASAAQDARSHWIDSVFSTMGRDQKIGQLFMVPVSTHTDEDAIDELADLAKDGDIGGYYVVDGGPLSHIRLLARLQKTAKIPLIVGGAGRMGTGPDIGQHHGISKTNGCLRMEK
ncbi:MAG: hypothetical protein WDN75_12360 [Bacteroidota bacterium]